TALYYRARDERLAVHPALRLLPPRRELGRIEPAVILRSRRGRVQRSRGRAPRVAQHIAAADSLAGCKRRTRVAGVSTQLAARKAPPTASAPPAASKKKWLPVPTMTRSITAG